MLMEAHPFSGVRKYAVCVYNLHNSHLIVGTYLELYLSSVGPYFLQGCCLDVSPFHYS